MDQSIHWKMLNTDSNIFNSYRLTSVTFKVAFLILSYYSNGMTRRTVQDNKSKNVIKLLQLPSLLLHFHDPIS